MDRIVTIQDKNELEVFLRKNTPLHIYSIGDLDDFYWRYTQWYGLKYEDELEAVVLIYSAVNPSVLLALCRDEELSRMTELLAGVLNLLPKKFYSHLSPGVDKIFKNDYSILQNGNYCKMLLQDNKILSKADTGDVERLSVNDTDALNELYSESYPDNSFNPRMLKTGMYFGIREGDKIISVSGVHVFSKQYRVAALGNITTHRDCRGKGLGTKVTVRLCRELINYADVIGMNVNIHNTSAIRCYEKIGFRRIASYNEFMIERIV
jgi:ribosomal protein S18 acetylase RimI-like enzyme